MNGRSKARWLALSAGLTPLVLLALAPPSRADRTETGAGATLIVGAPSGATVTVGLDVRRDNVSDLPLPKDALRTLWSRALRETPEPPLVLPDGTVVVVGVQGDAFFLNPDGTDRARVSLGDGPFGAPTLLTDGSIVAIDGGGDAVFVNPSGTATRTHLAETTPEAPPRPVRRARLRGASLPATQEPASMTSDAEALPLFDGGVVVAVGRVLSCLDRDGTVRSRAIAKSPVVSPLVAAMGGVAFMTDGGDVYTWNLRSDQDGVARRGALGIHAGKLLMAMDDRHLLAVVDGSRAVTLDLVTGETETRITSAGELFTGAFAYDAHLGTLYLEEMTTTGTRLLDVDKEGQASAHGPPLTTLGLVASLDAGTSPVAPHTALFADRQGDVAYGTVDGRVGVATRTGKIELGTSPCGAAGASTGVRFAQNARVTASFVGLAPAGPGAFVVACQDGVIALVRGDL